MTDREVFSRRVYRAGQVVFREGEPGEIMYLVQRGSVEIWRGRDARHWTLGIVPQGGVFGEMALFDGKPRMASAVALEDTVLVEIPGDTVRDALKRSDPLVVRLLTMLLDNMRGLAGQIDQQAVGSAPTAVQGAVQEAVQGKEAPE